MRRFFAENLDTGAASVVLRGDEARHISLVLRMHAGDEVLLINGSGEECEAVIVSSSESEVTLKIKEMRTGSAEPAVSVTLYQCLPKQGKMEVIIQKCVELGIGNVVPTVSKRCIVKIEGKDSKLQRWNKVSLEASKQSGRALIPKVEQPVLLSAIDFSGYDLILFAYENESERTLRSVLRELESIPRSIAIIIGPEGGFEAEEAESIIARGGVSVSLGKRILRTETAGMAMLAQIMYELD